MSTPNRPSDRVRRRLRAMGRRVIAEQAGFNIVELLMAMVLMLLVLGATLALFNDFEIVNRQTNIRNDSQDQLRTGVDRLAHNLRNLAGANSTQSVIDRAGAYDLMFLTVDPTGPTSGLNGANLRRVRYCIDNTNPANEVLWTQVQTWTSQQVPAAPSASACPSTDSAWSGSPQRYAEHITNQNAGQNRPAFAYNSSTPASITLVHADLFVNTNLASGPPTETHLSTGVFLRNQNLPPSASFTATPGPSNTVTLNGSTSADPEGQPLTYVWYDGPTKIGTGITFTYQGTAGSHPLQLKVYDPAGLEGDSATQTVTLAP